MNKSVHSRVLDILAPVLEIESDNVTPISRETCDSWDSLKHLEIIFALEDEFALKFSEEEIIYLDSSQQAVNILSGKGVSR